MYNSIELIVIYAIFFMIGLMLAGQAFLMKLMSSNWDEVKSTITRIEIYNKYKAGRQRTYHDVYVTYEYNGQVYENKLLAYASSWREGTELKIKVNPDNPDNIYSNANFMISIVIGGLFMIISIALCFYKIIQ